MSELTSARAKPRSAICARPPGKPATPGVPLQLGKSLNDKTTDNVDGHAERNAETVAIDLSKPKDKNFTLPVNAVFPTQHMRRIIAAAREGKTSLIFRSMTARKRGEKLYNTLTVIGSRSRRAIKPPADARLRSPRSPSSRAGR